MTLRHIEGFRFRGYSYQLSLTRSQQSRGIGQLDSRDGDSWSDAIQTYLEYLRSED